MTEAEKTQEQIWNDVGQQFKAMGESLAEAVDATSQDEKVQQDLKNMQAELKATAAQVSQKVKEAKNLGESPNLDEEANKLGELSGRLGEQAKAAGESAAQEVQPHLTGALSSVQEGVSQIINNLKKKSG
jgi:hypothetical protein